MQTALMTLIRVGLLALCWFMFTTSALQAQETSSEDTAATEETRAPRCERQRGPHGGHPLARLLECLDLSDQQRSDIEAILASERTELEPLMEQMRENRRAFRALPQDGTFDEGAVRALADQQAGLMTEMIVSRERVKAKVCALLTEEQRRQAEDMLARMDKRGPRFSR